MAAIAVATVFAQCASTPDLPRELTIQPGDLVVVTYHQPRVEGDPPRPDLVLRTLGNETREAVYSSSSRNVNAKVCEAVDMQPLLDVFANYGFFRRAGSDPAAEGATAVSVSVNGAARTWVRPDVTQATTPAELEVFRDAYQDFAHCMGYFTTAYNSIQGYASMRVSSEQEMQRQQRLLEEMRRKHKVDEQKPRGDGRP